MNTSSVREQCRRQKATEVVGGLLSFTLYLYIALYLLVPYKPWDFPVSFHTPVLGFGLLLMAIQVAVFPSLWRKYLKPDILLFSLMFLFFLVSSFLMHSREFSRSVFQIYFISFLSFLFVRTTIAGLNLDSVFVWINYYLIAAGALILLQVNFAGIFFISRFLGSPALGTGVAGWGFANGSTLAGGMLAWLFTISLARYVVSNGAKMTSFAWFMQLFSIAFGTAGVFYTFSRGAWLGVFCVVLVMAYAHISGGFPKKYLFIPLAVVVTSVVVLGVFNHREDANMRGKESFFIRLLQKPFATVSADGSTNTRAVLWRYTLGLIKDTPAWGIGVGNFPRSYSKAYQKLAIPANGVIDQNPDLTPHNSYLYYMAELGVIPAFFLFLLVGWVVFKGFHSGYYSDAFPFWAGLVAVCVWVSTNDYACERIFWIVLGVVSGLTHLRPKRLQTSPETDGILCPK